MTCIVALSGLGVALADDKPTVVAVWEHRVIGRDARPLTMTLYSNHKINDPDGKNVWSRSRNILTLTWPNPKAPGGKWVDRCTVSPDGKTYSGRNQVGARLAGKLVSVTADLNPKAPPTVSRRLPGQTPWRARRNLRIRPGSGPVLLQMRGTACGSPSRNTCVRPTPAIRGPWPTSAAYT